MFIGNIELFVDVWPAVGSNSLSVYDVFKFPFVNREAYVVEVKNQTIFVFLTEERSKNIFEKVPFFPCWHMMKIVELEGIRIRISKESLSRDLFEIFNTPWQKGRLYAGYGIKLSSNKFYRKAIQEWQKVNKPYAKLFSAELYRLLGEFDKAKKLLDQAKKHYQKGKAAYYCRVVKELIKMKTTHFYDVPDIIGETQHKVGELTLLISPSGIKLRKVKKGFLGKKFVVEEISKREAMKFFDKLDDLGKAKLSALRC